MHKVRNRMKTAMRGMISMLRRIMRTVHTRTKTLRMGRNRPFEKGLSHNARKLDASKSFASRHFSSFSNREKLALTVDFSTCRERKKKCDELKPVCRNCTRGNFRCKGYGPKNELDTRLGPRGPQPLQSKGVQNPPPPGYYPP